MVTLSIGIPTYERPALLKRLINTIINQKNIDDYNIEILIGDDSKKNIYSEIEESLTDLPVNIEVKYKYHTPAKGQNENVGSLIERATGNFFCLMHDDDYFLDGAIKTLLKAVQANPDCIVFGKQMFVAKEFDYKTSDKINNDFKRSTVFTGRQKDTIEMAMLQQCPNDGFILPTAAAKKLGSRPANIIGTACDFDFALRAAVTEKLNFYFVDEYTTVYAISDDSVTTSFENNAGERKLNILYEFKTNQTHPKIFDAVLKTDLSMVISHYIIVKNYAAARKQLFSINNFFKFLWKKPATYLQLFRIVFKPNF
ncbi:MAG: glycosyltransferase family 2 protein [Janthinobacterium lividum]